MSNAADPNFGYVGGRNGFEEWACDDFNLLEYVGKDTSPFDHPFTHDDFDTNDDDESLRKKDVIYSTWQINHVLLPHDQSNDHFNDLSYVDNGQLVMQPLPATSSDDVFMVRGGATNNPMVPSTSKANSAAVPQPKIVKIEIDPTPSDYNHSRSGFESVYEYDDHIPRTPHDSGDYTNKMKPRKYRIKPDSEKRNPHYRAKREKNNDAVRKSRDKAKRLQEEKEERLHFLEGEHVKQAKLIDQLRTRNEFLETQLISFKRSCTCQRPPIR